MNQNQLNYINNRQKYHLTPNSGAVKGNNPFILNRMTISKDFKQSAGSGLNVSGLVGYDTQGNSVSNNPQNTLNAAFETGTSYSTYQGTDQRNHLHSVIAPDTLSVNQMMPPTTKFSKRCLNCNSSNTFPVLNDGGSIGYCLDCKQTFKADVVSSQTSQRPVLTPELLNKIQNTVTHSVNPHRRGKKGKRNRHKLPQLARRAPTAAPILAPIKTQMIHAGQVPGSIPDYDQITTTSEKTTVENPYLMHRNGQLNHFRTIDQTKNGIIMPAESQLSMPVQRPNVPNGDKFKLQLQQQIQQRRQYQNQQQQASNNGLGSIYSEPSMDNGLWYGKKALSTKEANDKHEEAIKTSRHDVKSYNDLLETGTNLDEAFLEPPKW